MFIMFISCTYLAQDSEKNLLIRKLNNLKFNFKKFTFLIVTNKVVHE